MTLETERLLLRQWEERDATDLFHYASAPAIGPMAGWPPHKSVEESLGIIRNFLDGPETYAMCLKDDGRLVGSIELKVDSKDTPADECNLGFWIGQPYWGRGLTPEAAREILRHAFEDIGITKVWCRFYDGNTQSKRVQEKLGFVHVETLHDVDIPRLHEKRTVHVNAMTRDAWLARQRRA